MLYQLSHFFKNKFPFAWSVVEWFNEKLFLLLYGRRLQHLSSCLNKYPTNYQIREATLDDVQPMVNFFDNQPQEAFFYFHPHEFDENNLRQLVKKKSFLMYLVSNSNNEIVGYFFLRCFFNGKCFRGKIVDYRWRGKGIAVLMGKISTTIAKTLRMRMFGTISKSNLPSLASSQESNEIKIIKELPNDYLYIEYLPKTD